MTTEILTAIWETASIIGAEILTAIWEAIPIIGIMFAAVAAVGACYSAVATKRAAQGQLYFSLLREYSSDEMNKKLSKLFDVEKKIESDPDYWSALLKYWNDNRQDTKKIEQAYPGLNQARRCISHYYLTALELYKNKKCIDKRFLEVICEGNGFELLYEVVEHLEQAKNPNYARCQFDTLLELCGRSDEVKKRLKRDRP